MLPSFFLGCGKARSLSYTAGSDFKLRPSARGAQPSLLRYQHVVEPLKKPSVCARRASANEEGGGVWVGGECGQGRARPPVVRSSTYSLSPQEKGEQVLVWGGN